MEERKRKFRMVDWFLISLALLALVAVMRPQHIPVMVAKVALVTVSGWVGYWFDRGIAPTTRPDDPHLTSLEMAAASVRRAIVIGAAMIAGGLGA